jgi:cobalt/nickel transport system permease protein
VPRPVRELILLIYRLIFVFLERAFVGRQAQVARLGYDGPRQSIRSLGWLAGSLFQRSLDRGRRLETGLAARGFTGDLPQLGSDRVASGFWLLAGVMLPVGVAAVSLGLTG